MAAGLGLEPEAVAEGGEMTRIQWLRCWDKLRDEIGKKNSWGKKELLDLMNRIEMDEVRQAETGDKR
jgi:hypothetical protein